MKGLCKTNNRQSIPSEWVCLPAILSNQKITFQFSSRYLVKTIHSNWPSTLTVTLSVNKAFVPPKYVQLTKSSNSSLVLLNCTTWEPEI